MGLRKAIVIFLSILLVLSLEGFIITSVIGNLNLGKSVDNAVKNIQLSPDIPDEIKTQLDGEATGEEINNNLERSGVYRLIGSLGKTSRWFAVASVILVLAIFALALGSSLLVLGIVALIVGLPFIILGAIYNIVERIVAGALPSEIESFARPEITNLLNGAFAQLASYLIISLIVGAILIIGWFAYKIMKRFVKIGKKEDGKKERSGKK